MIISGSKRYLTTTHSKTGWNKRNVRKNLRGGSSKTKTEKVRFFNDFLLIHAKKSFPERGRPVVKLIYNRRSLTFYCHDCKPQGSLTPLSSTTWALELAGRVETYSVATWGQSTVLLLCLMIFFLFSVPNTLMNPWNLQRPNLVLFAWKMKLSNWNYWQKDAYYEAMLGKKSIYVNYDFTRNYSFLIYLL